MKIVRTEGGEYNDCIVKYFDLFDYDTNDPNSVLFWGWSSIDNEEKKAEYENYSKKYFINTAMPCEIIGGYVDILKQSYFDEVLTICPYTANVLNTTQNKITNTLYTPICFPFREKYFDKYKNITISDKEKDEMLKRLDEINAQAIHAGVPVCEEAAYFNFLNAIFLLKVKIHEA